MLETKDESLANTTRADSNYLLSMVILGLEPSLGPDGKDIQYSIQATFGSSKSTYC